MPGLDVGGREAAKADREEVHVEKGYLGPGFEVRGEAESC